MSKALKGLKLVDIQVDFRTDFSGKTYVKNNEITFFYEFDCEKASNGEKGTLYCKHTFNSPDSKELLVGDMISYFNDAVTKGLPPTEEGFEKYVLDNIEEVKKTILKKIKSYNGGDI